MLRARYVATICIGSFLLFLVQPMVARMALPQLGGSPSVWNSAMLVYQALLLAGYAYAHWLGGLALRRQAMVHLALLALAAFSLPIALHGDGVPSGANPFLWAPLLFLLTIGPLFFVVSAQAPLMQRWFALSGGGDPYPLYAASNLGSFAGLIAYPLVVEPLLPVETQSWMWSLGYGLLALAVLWAALALPRLAQQPAEAQSAAPLTMARQRRWLVLAAIPSGLMLSTSLHLTTDIVAMPLLWVMPLGLYLLSFSAAFAANRGIAELCTRAAPFFLLMSAAAAFGDATQWPYAIASMNLLSLFTVATALHARMFDDRPEAAQLTRFYFVMSAGGVAGGLFCALLAPLVFDWTYEHPILLVAAAVLLAPVGPFPGMLERMGLRNAGFRQALPVLTVLAIACSAGGGALGFDAPDWLSGLCAILIIAIALLTMGRTWLFAIAMVALMLSLDGWGKLSLSAKPGAMTRSFFGIYALWDQPKARLLVHGTTVHGIQLKTPGKETTPTTYYARHSGIGIAMRAVPAMFGPGARIGIVGLGAGTLACYARPEQSWRFYEIDPAIERIARDTSAFTFLSRCQPDADVAIGDARLVLAREPRGRFDLLAIDAFSSDSVPMHLLTKEALAIYARALTPDGVLMFHISNRHLDLEPVVAAGVPNGWHVAIRDYSPGAAEREDSATSSVWIALSPDPSRIAALKAADAGAKWRAPKSRPGFAPWTDSHASILPVLKALHRD